MTKLFKCYSICFMLFNYIIVDAKNNLSGINSDGLNNGFIENKGQIHDQNFKPNPEVKYLLNTPGMNVQLRTNSFSYDTYTIEQKENSSKRRNLNKKVNLSETENIYHFHRVDIEFIGANAMPEIISEDPSGAYFNYYTTGTSERGATNVRSFSKVTYKNLYPNIDLEFIANNEKVKYNFILHYGADINKIRWQYKGSENTEIKNQNISIKVSQGSFDESIPESYLALERNNFKKNNVKINFKSFPDNTFGFASLKPFSINKGELLVIDPTLARLWATYFGGNSPDYIMNSCVDKLGNTYHIGITQSISSIATVGAYQTTYGGVYDAMIFKLSSGGTPQWATYYGGNDDDDGLCIVVDKSNNLFTCGYTSSTVAIATGGAHQASYGGGLCDGYLAKFSNSGNLLWGTYYGGSGDDASFFCQVDTTGDLFLAGASTSSNAISTPGTYQPSYTGLDDSFLIKFNTNGVRQWGTYYGGTGDEDPKGCSIDFKNNVFLTGYTTSSVSISTPSAHQVGYGGNQDGFLVKFNNNGALQWGTYYGGSGLELAKYVVNDSLGNVYITGWTKSVDSISTLGSQQPIYGGAGPGGYGDAFLVKFDSSGVRRWGTYYGGTQDDEGTGLAIKGVYVYMCLDTQSPTQISTPNTYQNAITTSYAEMALAKFNSNGTLIWGTYYGGTINDIPYSVLIDPFDCIYLCGQSDGNFPVTAGAYKTTHTGVGNDGAIVKFKENAVGTGLIEIKLENNYLNIFPNPNNGTFILESKEDMVLNIVNELGQNVKTIKLDASNNHQYCVSNLATGIYCISDKQSGKSIQNKIVVTR